MGEEAVSEGAPTLLDWLYQRRDEEAATRGRMTVVRLGDTSVENNANGPTRWYMHPALTDRCIQSTIVFRHEIPPHSATGIQRIQGNRVLYAISGHGHTVLNGTAHTWEAGDVIAVPVLPDGVTVQHVNESDETALLIAAEPNWTGVFGVAMGSGFEQVESWKGGEA
jgi:gentisate 1,2-dioxygenase